MVATNDDLLAELQKQTALLKQLKKLQKGIYGIPSQADDALNKPDD